MYIHLCRTQKNFGGIFKYCKDTNYGLILQIIVGNYATGIGLRIVQ